jgi:uncharacterized protein
MIYTSNRCNLKCSYCYVDGEKEVINTKENIDKYLDILFTSPYTKDREGIVIDFIGGEPFIEMDLIEHTVESFFHKVKQYNHHWGKCGKFHMYATTNGTLVNAKRVKDFLNKYPFFSIGISIDGPEEEHDKNRIYKSNNCGSFKDVIPNYEWARERYGIKSVKSTISHNTITSLPSIVKFQIEELKNTKITCGVAFKDMWTEDDVKLLEKSYYDIFDYLIDANKEFYIDAQSICKNVHLLETLNGKKNQDYQCGSGAYMSCLDTYGNIYPCHMFIHKTKNLVVGNVDTGFDIEKINTLLNKFKDSNCDNCILSNSCVKCIGQLYNEESGTFDKAYKTCKVALSHLNNTKVYMDKIIDNAKSTIEWI